VHIFAVTAEQSALHTSLLCPAIPVKPLVQLPHVLGLSKHASRFSSDPHACGVASHVMGRKKIAKRIVSEQARAPGLALPLLQ
jgi:hypothetical protein